MRVMQPSAGLPLISIEQEPHLPALQFHRIARSGAWVAWSRWMMSRTTSPSLTSTSKSSNCPPAASPRQTRKWRTEPNSLTILRRLVRSQLLIRHVLLQLGQLEQREQFRAQSRYRLAGQQHVAVGRQRADQVELAPRRVHLREVLPGVPAARLLPLQRGLR